MSEPMLGMVCNSVLAQAALQMPPEQWMLIDKSPTRKQNQSCFIKAGVVWCGNHFFKFNLKTNQKSHKWPSCVTSCKQFKTY